MLSATAPEALLGLSGLGIAASFAAGYCSGYTADGPLARLISVLADAPWSSLTPIIIGGLVLAVNRLCSSPCVKVIEDTPAVPAKII
eukprot:COSAG01_NODE_616_length_14815_cov_8.518076_2_plen_87_part_00